MIKDKGSNNQKFTTKIGKQQLDMMKNQPLSPLLDLSLSRMYFHSFGDVLIRFTLLIVQLIWIAIIFFYGVAFGQTITDSLQISFLIIQQTVLRIVAMSTTIFFTVIILIMILPIFLSRTVIGIGFVCIFYLLFGTFFNLLLIGIGIYTNIISTIPYNSMALVFAIVTMFVWFVSIIIWLLLAKKRKKAVTKSIIKTYQLNFK